MYISSSVRASFSNISILSSIFIRFAEKVGKYWFDAGLFRFRLVDFLIFRSSIINFFNLFLIIIFIGFLLFMISNSFFRLYSLYGTISFKFAMFLGLVIIFFVEGIDHFSDGILFSNTFHSTNLIESHSSRGCKFLGGLIWDFLFLLGKIYLIGYKKFVAILVCSIDSGVFKPLWETLEALKITDIINKKYSFTIFQVWAVHLTKSNVSREVINVGLDDLVIDVKCELSKINSNSRLWFIPSSIDKSL